MKKFLVICASLLLSSCLGNYRKIAEMIEESNSYGYYEDNSSQEEYVWVHSHDADCVHVFCENTYMAKYIHITNVCDESIDWVEIKYIAVPENAYRPGVNSFRVYNLSPGQTKKQTIQCNGYETAIIVQDIIVE